MRTPLKACCFLAASLLITRSASAQQDPPSAEQQGEPSDVDRLVIGTRVAPPFVTRGDAEAYDGLAIDLLDEIAANIGFEYEVREYELAELLDAAASGEIDMAVGAITVTAEREERVDFTHPYYATSLAIAVEETGGISWLAAIKQLFSPQFISAVGALALVLLVAGLLVWVAERKHNAEQFGRGAKGIGAAFWWSAVTMTTVGYGDKAPVTIGGRIVALVWMFASIIIISGFTAAIATSLTVSSLGRGIQAPDDLKGKRVGVLAGAASASALKDLGAKTSSFESGEALLTALGEKKIDAVVHDEPVLRWWRATLDVDTAAAVLPETFQPQDYAFALPPESPLREQINLAILNVIASDDWKTLVEDALNTRH
ncbi:MAG: ABC transporter substrate-binding protein [Phycisphaerae bacterium]|nr:ABC transporter substrate-binding protein [Phycisphaerae bacterium]